MPRRPRSFSYVPASERRRDANRAYELVHYQERRLRRTRQWAKVRELIRERFPLCCDPFRAHQAAGQVVEMADVHHIIPLRLRPDLALAPSNLAPLCRPCHAKVHARMNRGEGVAHLFEPFRKLYAEQFGDME